MESTLKNDSKVAENATAITALREGLQVALAVIQRPKLSKIAEDLPQKVSELQGIIKQFSFLENVQYLAESFADEYTSDKDRDNMHNMVDEIRAFISQRDSFLADYEDAIADLNRMTEGLDCVGESFISLIGMLDGKGAA